MDELLAEVQAARETEAALKDHTDQIKALLVKVRLERPDLGLADIEAMIGRYYDRATISRVTVPLLGDRRTRKPTRAKHA